MIEAFITIPLRRSFKKDLVKMMLSYIRNGKRSQERAFHVIHSTFSHIFHSVPFYALSDAFSVTFSFGIIFLLFVCFFFQL